MAPWDSSPVHVLVGVLLAAAAGACARGPETDPSAHSPDAHIRAILTSSAEPVLPLATGDTIHLSEELRAFYEARGYRPAWRMWPGSSSP